MLTTHYKLSKKAFEQMLFEVNGNTPIGYLKHYERDWGCGSEKPIHLYYDRLDNHIGTWHDGACWTFNEHMEILKETV